MEELAARCDRVARAIEDSDDVADAIPERIDDEDEDSLVMHLEQAVGAASAHR